MKIVILAGMSGAGKTSALNVLEGMDYFCTDNLPAQLLEPYAELCARAGSGVSRAAIAVDACKGPLFDAGAVLGLLDAARGRGVAAELLFMDASDERLMRRYRAARRDHPLARGGAPEEGIARERKALELLRGRASCVMDTTNMTIADLRGALGRMFGGDAGGMQVEVTSFGFKRGAPRDADMLLDVRFLPNPYHVPEMRERTGLDADVSAYVLDSPDARELLRRTGELASFMLERGADTGKRRFVIAVGCTGGQHRSVAVAEALGGTIAAQGYAVCVKHRDMRASQNAEREAASGRA